MHGRRRHCNSKLAFSFDVSLVPGVFPTPFPFSVHEIDTVSQHLEAGSTLNYVCFFLGKESKTFIKFSKGSLTLKC